MGIESNKRQHNKLNIEYPLLAHPTTGTVLAILSGLSFLFLCMILPIVGPAAAARPYYATNYRAFLGVLLISLALALLAFFSKLQRRSMDSSPFPASSLALAMLLVGMLFALLMGLLKI